MGTIRAKKAETEAVKKHITLPLLLGIIFVVCGMFLLLRATGVLADYERFFWAAVFVSAGALFLVHLIDRIWWTVYPGFPLLGTAGGIIAFPHSAAVAWAVFFILSSGSFWLVYAADRKGNWWALMPGGTLVSFGIALIAGPYVSVAVSVGLFCLGLSLSFLLLQLFCREHRWAYIPSIVLAVTGVLCMALGTSATAVLYLSSAILIAVGAVLLVRVFFRRK